MKQEILRMWNEYQMHMHQGITYVEQGYVLPDGTIPAWKMDEHVLIHKFASQAQKELEKRKG